MKNDTDNSLSFETPGERLNHILDNAEFKRGRGRPTEFHHFLKENAANAFEDLKYTTVRAWFSVNSPPMKKIIPIIECLDRVYGFKNLQNSIEEVKTWWKVGGYYPFETRIEVPSDVESKKLEFLLPSIILEEVGEDFQDLSTDSLEEIKSATLKFAIEFSDPTITTCPNDYLKMAISYFHKNLKNR